MTKRSVLDAVPFHFVYFASMFLSLRDITVIDSVPLSIDDPLALIKFET